MKLFLIFLAIGFASPDKLDRTYLPPPGAKLAGGSPGDILAPPEILDLPHGDLQFGIDGGREPKPIAQSTVVPITTTSYAFTQTTTYPPIENYESTAAHTDLITGLPVQIITKPGIPDYSRNYPTYGQNQGQNIPQFDETNPNLSGDQYKTDTPNYDQLRNKLQNQYTNQYPNIRANENFDNISNNNYRPSQQGFLPSNISTQESESNRLPIVQYRQDGSKITPSTPSYSRPSINTQETDQRHFSPENKNPADDLNKIIAEAFSSQPNQYSENVFSTTPATNFPSTSLEYSSVVPIKRLERPQAEADRNAVIINYENVRTPTGYSYSYDTSNGIHADENGTVGDGTRAQGSYSYIGDDGKIYSVIYTADENGFQPRGEHLPTPPPVPEAIQRVIEQAIREKEADIVDDGSYDEERYGYKKYVQPKIHRNPQLKMVTKQENSLSDDSQSTQIQPISAITEDVYDYDEMPNRPLNVDFSGKNNMQPIYKQTSEYPTKTDQEYSKKIPGDNIQVLHGNKNYSPLTELNKNKDRKVVTPNSDINNYYTYKNTKTKYSDTERDDIGLPDRPEASFYNYKGQDFEDRVPVSYEQKPLIQGSLQIPIQEENQQVDKDGYQYNPPEFQFRQTEFPARFKTQDLSSTTKPTNGKISEKGTTRRPFLTPEVYNQPSHSNDEGYQQSTTRRPFVTPEVTTRKSSSYNNYNDDNDYNIGQKISNNDGINKGSKGNFNTPISTVSNLNTFSPSAKNTYITEKGTTTPRYESSTFTHKDSPVRSNSRFNGRVTTQRTNPAYQYGPTYSTDINEPVNSEKYPETQNNYYKYQPSTVTTSMYPVTNSGTYPNDLQPVYGSRIPYEQMIYTPQNYQTSTNIPVTSMASGFPPKSGVPIPSATFENAPNGPKQYEPNYYGTISSNQPISGYNPTTIPDNQQTTFKLNPTFSSSTTRRPDKSGTFILTGPDAYTPKFVATESYKSIEKYGSTKPSYTTTIKPNLTGDLNGYNPEISRTKTSNYPQKPALGYIYEPPSATTSSIATIGTTPGFLSSTTTDRPFYPSSENNYHQSLVDGFGRPILSEQQPEYPYLGQDAIKDQDTQREGAQESPRPGNQSFNSNDVPGREQYPSYTQFKNQPGIIGEDFTGPKQPQRFDPETGYHY